MPVFGYGLLVANDNYSSSIDTDDWIFAGPNEVYFQMDHNSCLIKNLKYQTISQSSLEEMKKNIEKLNINASEIVKNSDIYKYNYKNEESNSKKHIGFVIGNTRRTPKEVISNSEDGIDIYAMESILWKAMQEQQEQIETLQNKIKEMEEKINEKN